MPSKTGYTHCIHLPSMSEIEALCSDTDKSFFIDFFCAKNPDKVTGYDPHFQTYMGFGLYADQMMLAYFKNETNSDPMVRTCMRTDPNDANLWTLGQTRLNDVTVSFDCAFPSGYDFKNFRQALPKLLQLELGDRPDILKSFSDILITKLTPEGYGLETFLPIAPRNARAGGLIPV